MIDRDLVHAGIEQIDNNHDEDHMLAVRDAAAAFLALSTEVEKPGGLSEVDRAQLRSWAEQAAVRPKAERSRWVAQLVLRLLRENFNLAVKSRSAK